ncbi:uncharacterized protein MONBRDRAFT_12724 [Monosiga brevicollis MX1]|uniref:Uncharacterized protein n=1 Tax=Monosiga brevicollis TaxID=81824 RepID=A9VD47_MONBE|nr:uncharacterized protein MONBRDRAFT_12724 [Monosiga brevicollis MX1]EDQ84527.1 predicted protein [Monosiga brevicollis MX1]|eukprot:XP_001750643.1 hypothetical protein [Monosiga brevicollis MX1]
MAFWLKHHLEPSLSAQLVPPRCVGIMTVLPSSRRRRPHNAPGYLINPQHGHEPPCPRSTHPSAPAPNQSPSSLLPNGLDLPTKLPFGPFAFALSRVLSFASLSLRMRAYQEVASNNCGSSQPPDPLAHSSASLAPTTRGCPAYEACFCKPGAESVDFYDRDGCRSCSCQSAQVTTTQAPATTRAPETTTTRARETTTTRAPVTTTTQAPTTRGCPAYEPCNCKPGADAVDVYDRDGCRSCSCQWNGEATTTTRARETTTTRAPETTTTRARETTTTRAPVTTTTQAPTTRGSPAYEPCNCKPGADAVDVYDRDGCRSCSCQWNGEATTTTRARETTTTRAPETTTTRARETTTTRVPETTTTRARETTTTQAPTTTTFSHPCPPNASLLLRTVQAAKSAVAKPFPPRVLRQLAPLLVTRYVMHRVVSGLERHPLHFVETTESRQCPTFQPCNCKAGAESVTFYDAQGCQTCSCQASGSAENIVQEQGDSSEPQHSSAVSLSIGLGLAAVAVAVITVFVVVRRRRVAKGAAADLELEWDPQSDAASQE